MQVKSCSLKRKCWCGKIKKKYRSDGALKTISFSDLRLVIQIAARGSAAEVPTRHQGHHDASTDHFTHYFVVIFTVLAQENFLVIFVYFLKLHVLPLMFFILLSITFTYDKFLYHYFFCLNQFKLCYLVYLIIS